MDGKRVLTDDFLKKIKKSNFDVLLIVWPEKKSDSYKDLTCKLTLVFAQSGSIIKVTPWEPWKDFCSKKVANEPKLRIEKSSQYRILEIHQIDGKNYVRFVDDDARIVEYPLVNNSLTRLYFGQKSKLIAGFLNKKR
ncbi:hypothetical protein IKT64_01630 [Candidatus Saccharibacteria bacterium]|nr:hypothetical protein [Candidatus Saccharibacteria bacterium]